MNRYCLLILNVLCICAGQSLLGQDLEVLKSAFAKSTEYYEQQDSYALEMVCTFYEDTSISLPDEKLTGKFIKSRENYYSKIDQTETIYSNGEYVKINHEERALLYGKTNLSSQSKVPIALEPLLDLCDNVLIVPDDNAFVFEIDLKKNLGLSYSKVRLELSKQTYTIKKQILYFDAGHAYPGQGIHQNKIETPSKMEIIIDEVFLDIDQSIFSMSNYIRKGNPISLSNKLASYTFYNTTK